MTERIQVRIDPDISELVPGFLDNRRRDVERLLALAAVGDFGEIRLIGHSMKGAGGGYGFDRITELGAEIELAALAADAAAVRVAAESLGSYLGRLDIVLDA
jgi:HPt (histidine-containing phosphotransfer) domain-containing protein